MKPLDEQRQRTNDRLGEEAAGAEFRERIPVLNDVVGRDGDPDCLDRVPDSKTFDALVESLQRDLMDRVGRTLREVIAREEAGMRAAIRAHLEVMLPEIIEQWQRECREAREASARRSEAAPRFGRDYPGALEPMVAVPPDPGESAVDNRKGARRTT